jgi:nucleoside-diphosphate-sugar epimerase
VPSIAKIGAAIGWAPTVALDQTLDEVIAYFRELTPGSASLAGAQPANDGQ